MNTSNRAVQLEELNRGSSFVQHPLEANPLMNMQKEYPLIKNLDIPSSETRANLPIEKENQK